jgi:hypothetical protein
MLIDIHNFISSRDIADHCKKIGHAFNSLEMAVIVAMSDKPIKEKHTAWRGIIADYPDMPVKQHSWFDARDSLHDYLREQIVWEEQWLAEFYAPGVGIVYLPVVRRGGEERRDMGCFSTAGKAWAAVCEAWDWEEDEVDSAYIEKLNIDDGTPCGSLWVNSSGEATDRAYCGEGMPGELDMIFFHLPVPFKKGDLLECGDTIFVLDSLPHWPLRRGLAYEEMLSGKSADSSDMIGWGLFVDEDGVLYGDHTGRYDRFQYYRGKLKGTKRLLHYVSLFMQGEEDEIRLTELLTVQCRIMLERLLDHGLDSYTDSDS